jgi:hypothetical protein
VLQNENRLFRSVAKENDHIDLLSARIFSPNHPGTPVFLAFVIGNFAPRAKLQPIAGPDPVLGEASDRRRWMRLRGKRERVASYVAGAVSARAGQASIEATAEALKATPDGVVKPLLASSAATWRSDTLPPRLLISRASATKAGSRSA